MPAIPAAIMAGGAIGSALINKSSQNKARKAAEYGRDTTETQYSQLSSDLTRRLGEATAAGQGERANILSGYGDFAATGGISPDDAARLRAYASGGGGGGIDIPSYSVSQDYLSEPLSGYREFSKTGGINMGALTEALGGFRELSGREGGFDPTRLANINASAAGLRNIGQTGGYNPAREAQIVQDLYSIRSAAPTGGYDPTQLARIRGDVGRLREYGISGGLTADEINRIRDRGYEEFATTGGYTPGEIGDIRSRAVAPIQALAAADRRNLEQARRISGGALGAAIAARERKTGQELSDAALNAEISLADAIREGRRWGIEGRAGQESFLGELLSKGRITAADAAALRGTSLEGDVARNKLGAYETSARGLANLEQALVGNRLAGLTGAGELDLATQQAINAARLGGLRGITDTQYGVQNLLQQGRLAGLGGMTQIGGMQEQARAQAAASAAAAAAEAAASDYRNRAFGAGIEEYLIGTGQEGRLAGLRGLQGMYGQTYAPESELLNYSFNLPGARAAALQGYAYNPVQQGSSIDSIMRAIGAGASMAGAYNKGGSTLPFPEDESGFPPPPTIRTQPVEFGYNPIEDYL